MGNSCSPGCRWWCPFRCLLCCPFSRWVSWMGSGTLLSQFLRDFLPTLVSWHVEYVNLMNCKVDMLKCFRLLVALKRINNQELDCFASRKKIGGYVFFLRDDSDSQPVSNERELIETCLVAPSTTIRAASF